MQCHQTGCSILIGSILLEPSLLVVMNCQFWCCGWMWIASQLHNWSLLSLHSTTSDYFACVIAIMRQVYSLQGCLAGPYKSKHFTFFLRKSQSILLDPYIRWTTPTITYKTYRKFKDESEKKSPPPFGFSNRTKIVRSFPSRKDDRLGRVPLVLLFFSDTVEMSVMTSLISKFAGLFSPVEVLMKVGRTCMRTFIRLSVRSCIWASTTKLGLKKMDHGMGTGVIRTYYSLVWRYKLGLSE
jgi:hypothetical protein